MPGSSKTSSFLQAMKATNRSSNNVMFFVFIYKRLSVLTPSFSPSPWGRGRESAKTMRFVIQLFFFKLTYFVICHLSFVICHLSFVICHSSFVIRHLSFVICHSSFVICHSSFVIRHYQPGFCFIIPLDLLISL